MRLVVGLGNPGRRYEATRHNLGFWWVDALADQLGISLQSESRFQGDVGRFKQGVADCWFLKPDTFMNESGRSVRAMSDFYKIETSSILVVHDELDLDPGTVKLKKGGGVAGHNGLRDVAAHLGKDFWRLRLGIGHPGDRKLVSSYVLAPPTLDETKLISEALERSLTIWPRLIEDDFAGAMHQLHTRE